MGPELTLFTGLGVGAVAFCCQYMDATLGMGYGITITPVLLLAGFEPLQIVPAVLVSQFLAGVIGGLFHHAHGNANLLPKRAPLHIVAQKLQELGYVETLRRGFPRHLKVALVLTACGVPGAVAAVVLAVNIPSWWIELYVGLLVLGVGIALLFFAHKRLSFSWGKIGFLGVFASFNKALTGGGYGPLVTGGQMLSGVESRNAVSITTLAQGLTCFTGIVTYVLVAGDSIEWVLTRYTLAGGLLSLPLCALTVRKIGKLKLELAVAGFTILLGALTLVRTFSTM